MTQIDGKEDSVVAVYSWIPMLRTQSICSRKITVQMRTFTSFTMQFASRELQTKMAPTPEEAVYNPGKFQRSTFATPINHESPAAQCMTHISANLSYLALKYPAHFPEARFWITSGFPTNQELCRLTRTGRRDLRVNGFGYERGAQQASNAALRTRPWLASRWESRYLHSSRA